MIQPSLAVARAAELALAYHLPAASLTGSFARAGGLLSYSANYTELWREMAVYVAKILNGAKPANLPVAQPTKFELVINLKTAEALGLSVPPIAARSRRRSDRVSLASVHAPYCACSGPFMARLGRLRRCGDSGSYQGYC